MVVMSRPIGCPENGKAARSKAAATYVRSKPRDAFPLKSIVDSELVAARAPADVTGGWLRA